MKIVNKMNDIIINDKFLFIQIPKTSTTTLLNICKKYKMTKKLNC